MESHEERIQEIIERVCTQGVVGVVFRWPWADSYYLVTEQRTRSQ